jgi:hypothetical protein
MDAQRTTRARAREVEGEAAGTHTRPLVLILGVAGGLLLAVAEFTTVASVDVAAGACDVSANPALADRCTLTGFERHGGALLLLGALAVAMALGAGRGASRPAAIALIAIAAIVLVLAIVRDLPETRETGAIGVNFEGATAKAGPGLYLEIVAGLLLAGGGALSLARRR